MGPIVGLAVVADFTPGPVDVWMKDCLEDVGDIPSVPGPPCTVAFKSPDIWIDNNQDMILDPHRPGYQWKDPDPVKGTVTYAIRVADEGGNVSEASPRVKVEGPQGPGKWLTWLLLLVIGVLLVLVIWRRSAS